MKVILFGATGMVGQGVLRECLRDDAVEEVLSVGRRSTGRAHPKLRDLVLQNLFEFNAAGESLQGYNACFFCLGVSSTGMSEPDYTRTLKSKLSNAENELSQIHCYGSRAAAIDLAIDPEPVRYFNSQDHR